MRELAAKTRSIRIFHTIIFFAIFLFIIVFRLFYLQIDRKGVFYNLGERNFLRVEVLPPLRGDVYDCNKVLIAANKAVFDLYWQGSGEAFAPQDMDLLKTLSVILGKDLKAEEFFKQLSYSQKNARRFLIKEDLSFQQLCMISELSQRVSSIVVENRFKRIYPHNQLASHVLGFLSRSDNVGKAGIESKLHDELKGVEGRKVHVITATGKSLMQRIEQEALAGKDLTLTLDFETQKIAESIFTPEQSGALVLMDPYTGAIKAFVSVPQYDPNVFLGKITEEEWGSMSVNNPMLNRVTSAQYPPASTFKLVSVAAALEEKVIDEEQGFCCRGYTLYCGRRYHCLNRDGHGVLHPREALSRSCNIPFFQIAKRIQVDRIAYYANQLGLGRPTGLLLPEKHGLVPTKAWKKKTLKEQWWAGENLSVCIGQSYLLATPLQILRMVSGICTGFLVRPRLLIDEDIETEPINISRETFTILKAGMRAAAQEGSARIFNSLKNFDVWAKTGTAQTCSLALSQSKQGKKYIEHGWLASFFSYKHERPLALVILLEHTGHSRYTTRLAYDFLVKYQDYLKRAAQE